MTNSISENNLILANFLYGVNPNKQGEIFTEKLIGEVGFGALLGAPLIVGAPYLFNKPMQIWGAKNPQNTWKDAWKAVKENSKAEKEALKYLKNQDSFMQTLKNKHQYSNLKTLQGELPNLTKPQNTAKPSEFLKYKNAKIANSYYHEARTLIEEAKTKKLTGAELKEQLKKIRNAMAKGDAKVNEAVRKGIIKPTGKLSKIGHKVKSATGYYKAKRAVLKTSRGASALRLASKGVKGCGIFAIIEGIIEIPDVIKAYKADKEEKVTTGISNNRGNKQLAKSSVKVASSVLGYAAGAAAAGAVAGTVVPGIGNLAGAVVGFVGGLIGAAVTSYCSGKVMDKALNKKNSLNNSEADLYAEAKEARKAKEKAEFANSSLDEQVKLLEEVEKKTEEQGGFDNEEQLKAYENLLTQLEEEYLTEEETQYVETAKSDYSDLDSALSILGNLA